MSILVVGCATALALNQSMRVSGLNLSVADPLVLVLFGLLALTRMLAVPVYVIVYFFLLVASALFTAAIVTPSLFGVGVDADSVFGNLAKLIVCLVYLICGIGVARLDIHMTVLRWFAFGAAGVAFLGLAMEFTGVRLLGEVMYYGDLRYRGFMVDPNYWSVVACAGIAFFLRDRRVGTRWRWVLVGALALSVVISASKTGMIALLVLFAISLMERALRSRHSGFNVVLLSVIVIVLIALWDPILSGLQSLVAQYSDRLPQLARVSLLLTDPVGSVSEGGSARTETWGHGMAIVMATPIVGVGIGAYQDVSRTLFGSGSVAHNTYLQIAAEWGLPFAIVFLVWIAVLLIRATSIGFAGSSTDTLTVRDMIIVFLVGSFSLSLNNARMFWLFVGILIALVTYNRTMKPSEARTRETRTFNGGSR